MSHSGCGKNSFSSSAAGVMALREPTTVTGASRWSKAMVCTFEATSCRKEPRSTASELSSRRPVFFTDSTTTSRFSGATKRRSMTSADRPYLDCRSSAASRARYRVAPRVAIVRSLPSRRMTGSPSGTS